MVLQLTVQGQTLSLKGVKDTVDARQKVDRQLQKWHRKGYSAAALDSFYCSGDSIIALLYKGEQRIIRYISVRETNDVLSAVIPISPTPFFASSVNNQIKEQLRGYEDRGYPFVRMVRDSIHRGSSGDTLFLSVDPGQLFRIDTLVQVPIRVVANGYLRSFTALRPGLIYNQRLINRATDRLRALPFLEVKSGIRIIYSDSTAKPVFFIAHRKASAFDGVIGFQQNELTKQFMITGDANARLINAFKRGEQVSLAFRGLSGGTRDLQLEGAYPYVFNTSLGLNAGLDLFKLDSQFVRNGFKVGIQYLFPGADYLELFSATESSAVLKASFAAGHQAYTKQLYGLRFFTKRTDDLLAPHKGVLIRVSLSYGRKQVNRMDSMATAARNDLQYESSLLLEKFLPIDSKTVLLVRLREQSMLGSEILQNELFRIGGLKTLRGFDEQSILASAYGVGTIELRRFLEDRSFVSVFFDQAAYRNEAKRPTEYDFPFGFGLGLALETKAGLFSLNYAVGKQLQNPLSLQQGKVHFGIVTLF